MKENLHIEETIKSEKIYEGRIIKVRVDTVELANRSYAKREIVEHQRAVAIVVLTDDDKVYLVNQYRKPVEKVVLEIPAGLVESNETLQEAAIRETQEEVGMRPNKLELLAETYSSPGFTDEKISIFLATDLVEDKLDLDEDEFVEPILIDLDEALDMIENYEIMDSKTIVGLLQVAKRKK